MDASRYPDYLLTYDAEEVQRRIRLHGYAGRWVYSLLPRLQLQHDVIIRAFDGHLIVAPMEVFPGMKILDSASGTGASA